ncbi:hypothetical protein [Mycolicibacterium sp.]|uniref:hypothetical protein n=1 Tax=Mycolicibacterium sp. TaxID=2320850 RepID=UPI0037C7B1F2
MVGQRRDQFDESSIEPLRIHPESRQDVFLVRSTVRRPIDHVSEDFPIEFIEGRPVCHRWLPFYGVVLKKTFLTSV